VPRPAKAVSRCDAILAAVDLVERKGSGTTRHPWELARAEFFLRLLDTHDVLAGDCKWLDAGAGDGWFARQLRRLLPARATITCWDVNYTKEDVETLGADGSRDGLAFVVAQPTERFDRVLMLDVLEHVDDDVGFLRAIVDDLLTDNGVVLVSVPAYPSLSGSHDRAMRHRRRYSHGACRRLLEQTGLAVVSNGGLFSSLLPVRAGQVLFERVRASASSGGVGSWRHGRLVTDPITRMLALDGRVSLALSRHGLSAPGLSYWALCRLPAGDGRGPRG
jgi:SAM-dependent methyltransferase